jgi:hypothetical protein
LIVLSGRILVNQDVLSKLGHLRASAQIVGYKGTLMLAINLLKWPGDSKTIAFVEQLISKETKNKAAKRDAVN